MKRKHFMNLALLLLVLTALLAVIEPVYADGGSWQKVGQYWQYENADGTYATSQWMEINGYKYYFNASSQMVTGWQKSDGKWYYLSKNGKMTFGWQKVNNKWYYMDQNGQMVTGWQTVNGVRYYLASTGRMVTGWQKINDTWYYFTPNGRMLSGWQKISGKWYYLGSDGKMQTGWQTINGAKYYLSSSGKMRTGWLQDGSWYYLASSGKMMTGWQKINGKWYFLQSDGKMLTGWHKSSGKWYYLKSSGAMAVSTWIGKYYVNSSGVWTASKGDRIIAIDAGHQRHGNSNLEPIGPGASTRKPMVSSGTSGAWSGLDEYELNLIVSLKLQKELEARGYKVYMIRTTHDVNISNSQRAKNAANAGADILVRIHANGDDNSSIAGALTMAPSRSNSFLNQTVISKSQLLSQKVIDSFCGATGARNRGVLTTDSMSGINWSTIPVTIVEMGYMSNRTDDLNMANASYQNKMVQGIANGIDQYYAAS